MVSSKDVAAKAGVSQTTVSRVLNAPNTVKEPTRLRVLKAIEDLGYIPNANARNLVCQKTHTISLISGPLHNPFYVDTTSEIVNFATQVGYKVNVHFTTTENTSEAYDLALSNKIDGLILSCILFNDPIINRLKKLDIPFISFNRKHEYAGNFVEIDNTLAGQQALEHLIDYGHRDILWIGATDIVSTFRNRLMGFKIAYEKFKLKYSDLRIRAINYKQLDKPDLHNMLTTLVHSQRLPTAICAATDSIAIDAIDILISLGVSIPDQISVIGIDNVDISKNKLIQLTTIGTEDNSRLGLIAIQELISLIEAKEQNIYYQTPRITKPTTLYLRGSTRKL
ncbi:LacI family DNA-binding transcriptional regulator [Gallibacterium anatis]|uniref:DNA-binding transcriptional repressor PurR n=2 Tax=Gallibacterium anatis TaxID=750 RepID=F4HAB8_GALAU|nr:LacI family DNA-binding transcriptional regulator [Gallibacterium anatis]AEC16150.1 DNA-binding transcriptional repressor PurR [Gallibacterium anatis UMN179]KGQ68889.1 transcriptional regulator [Gallibacterium anatis]MDK9429547.1 LacI family DNA-binding transcriptional regulator [Gallibacterium anatis]MDK9560689.1 LacI family DNA-binding transcriptional regulator [Gallibacterium anatis]WIM80396.1 LacI family DNA-binding transcriptional regulator [Gallibacterium anatis]